MIHVDGLRFSYPGAAHAALDGISFDIAQGEDSLALTFKGEAGEPVLLTLSAQPLRQWLGIVYEQYRKAEWPTGVWPAWVEDAQVSAEASLRSVVLH